MCAFSIFICIADILQTEGARRKLLRLLFLLRLFFSFFFLLFVDLLPLLFCGLHSHIFQILLMYFFRLSVHPYPSRINPDTAVADFLDLSETVRYNYNRCAAFFYFLHLFKTFFLKMCISHSQDFINQ